MFARESTDLRQLLLNAMPTRLRFALRYMAVHRRFSLLLRPATFTEKNMLRIAKDRRSLLQICADKLAMRRYVEQKIGPQYLPKILCHVRDPAGIPWQSLPEWFVVKANHGSGFVSVVTNFKPSDTARIGKLAEACKRWLAMDFGKWSGEWAYVGLPRQIFIEEFIESPCHDDIGVPWDFKFYVFDGRCAIIQVDIGNIPPIGRICIPRPGNRWAAPMQVRKLKHRLPGRKILMSWSSSPNGPERELILCAWMFLPGNPVRWSAS